MPSKLKKVFTLLSDRTNPIRNEERAGEFSGERRKFFVSAAAVAAEIAGIALICAFWGPDTADWQKALGLLLGGCVAMSAFSAAVFFRNMLVMKKGEYARKLMDVSGKFQDSYPVAKLKFAASFPELPPPIEAGYASAQKRFAKEIWVIDYLK